MKWETTAPERLEQRILRDYPGCETAVADMRRDLKASVGWPDWCWGPMGMSYAVVTNGAEMQLAQRIMGGGKLDDLQAMSAILPWRESKVIYHFDSALVEELTGQTTKPDDVPAALIQRMPFPCVYIETPPGVEDCEGVFAFLEWDARYPRAMELRMHYLFTDGEILPTFYQWTDDKASLANAMAADAARLANKVPFAAVDELRLKRFSEVYDRFGDHLALLIYLCSEAPDVERRGEAPRKRDRGGAPAATHPDHFEVGGYIGSVIRMGRERAESQGGGEGGGSAKRPHMRRAHWHLYWAGEGRSVPRVKWLSPIFVHGNGAEIPAVKHDVK